MKCMKCGWSEFLTIPDEDGDLLKCVRCGAMRVADLKAQAGLPKRELPTEEEMTGCPRGT